jgi:hypothetical protein
MNIKALEVLSDCKGALEELDGTSGSIWRRRFITAITLLRAVGHILHKVDSKTSNIYKEAIDSRWKIWVKDKLKHEIFWNFIEKERNFILKEYQINGGQSATVYIGDVPSCMYYYPMNDGIYKGRDQRDLIMEAIKWWEIELKIIEDEIKLKSNKKAKNETTEQTI